MTSWNKNIYRSLLILSFVGLNAIILWGLSEAWVFWNSGADKASILHTGIEVDDVDDPLAYDRMVIDDDNGFGSFELGPSSHSCLRQTANGPPI